MRNFNLPLPNVVYRDLREEAVRASRPATPLARQAIELWLQHRHKIARHEAIYAFGAEHACSPLDLHAQLEAVSIEHLVKSDEVKHSSVAVYPGPISYRDPARSKLVRVRSSSF